MAESKAPKKTTPAKKAAPKEAAAKDEGALAVGHAAPPFTLPDENEKPVSLASLRGSWVVLYFYPKDDTPGCTTEACEFTEGIQSFGKLSAKVFGVSRDSAASHRKFIAKHGLRIPLLTDADHAVMDAYGAWGTKNMYGKVTEGVIRSTLILDPEGKIARRWAKVSAKGHAEAVRAALVELQG